MKLIIELFCGSATLSKEAVKYGFNSISVDNRRRSGICEPTIKADILNIPDDYFTSLNPCFFYIAFPCTIFSNASGNYHIDNNFNPKTDLARVHFELFTKVSNILENHPGVSFMFENPRGKFIKYLDHIGFTNRYSIDVHLVTLSSYGFPTIKPTHFITNYPDLKFKKPDSFGRGAKNPNQTNHSNITTTQFQKTPILFYESLLRQLKNDFQKYPGLNPIL